MERRGKWEPIRELGEGGQGKVFVALDTGKVNLDEAVTRVQFSIQTLARPHTPDERHRRARELAAALRQFDAVDDSPNLGALKILHPPKDTAGLDKARARMENEVRAYEAVTHSNLLRLLDNHVAEGWFVTEYHPLGPLSNHSIRYRGNPLEALIAFRPLVEAVAALHSKGLVHRDIKPGNIFVRLSGDLILGDTGLVFFTDDQRTRVSDRIENVGSRDWMPGWAMGMRLEDVRPSFDVFALGKLLWAMISAKPILRLWYYREPEFDLEQQFPDDERMPWINRLLSVCIVEHEKDVGFPSAIELLPEVDKLLKILRRGGQVMRREVRRWCQVCGTGIYEPMVDGMTPEAADSLRNFGLNPVGHPRGWRIFRCSSCGHIQMFRLDFGAPSWGIPGATEVQRAADEGPVVTPEDELENIIRWFDNADPVVRKDAVKELNQVAWRKRIFHHEATRSAVRRLMKDESPDVRVEVLDLIRTLMIHEKDVVGRYYMKGLLDVVESDPNLDMRARVMGVIGISGDSGYLEHVYGWMRGWGPDVYTRVNPTAALVGLVHSGLGGKIRNDLRALIDQAREGVRARYVEALQAVRDVPQ